MTREDKEEKILLLLSIVSKPASIYKIPLCRLTPFELRWSVDLNMIHDMIVTEQC